MSILSDQDALSPLRGAEKVAAVLLALDKEVSGRVLKHFDQRELRQIARIAAHLGSVTAGEVEEICEGLIDEINNNQLEFVGGQAVAEDLLASALPDEQVADIISDVWGRSNKFIWKRVGGLPEKLLADYLSAEHPQTAAVVLGRLEPAFAAGVLALLPSDMRAQAMRRMLIAKPVTDAIFHIIEESLQEELFTSSANVDGGEASTRVAGIVNQLEREQISEIIAGISASEPLLAEQLRGMIFSFEDIESLSQRARMIIFDQAQTETVILALRGASAEMRDAVLPCLSARTRRMVEAELATAADPPRRDILSSQRDLANLVLRLVEQGMIDLAAERSSAQSGETGAGS